MNIPIQKIQAYIPVSECLYSETTGEPCATHGNNLCYAPLKRTWRDELRDRVDSVRLAVAKRLAGYQWPGDDG